MEVNLTQIFTKFMGISFFIKNKMKGWGPPDANIFNNKPKCLLMEQTMHKVILGNEPEISSWGSIQQRDLSHEVDGK